MQKYSVVLNIVSNKDVSDSMENNLEIEIKNIKPMTVLDSNEILDDDLGEVIEELKEVTHKPKETK